MSKEQPVVNEGEVMTFDEILEDKTYQSEFDKRVTKAIKTVEERYAAEIEKLGNAAQESKSVEELKIEFEAKEKEYQAELEQYKFNSIVELEVIKSGTIDPVGVKAHLQDFLKEAKVEDGLIVGLDEKLNTIKTEMKHYYPNEKLNGSSGLEGKVVPNKTTREEVMSGFGIK